LKKGKDKSSNALSARSLQPKELQKAYGSANHARKSSRQEHITYNSIIFKSQFDNNTIKNNFHRKKI
jgi:hypothetical protein